MKRFPILILMVILVSFIAMGCNEESSNKAPRALLVLEPSQAILYDNETGVENPEITFNASGSSDSDGEIRNYHYEYGEGNSTDLSVSETDRTYTFPGYFNPGLTVSDSDGAEDTMTNILIINYQYIRENQLLDATSGASEETEHPFPISEYYPDSGVVTVEISAEFGSPDANVTLKNADDEVVAHETRTNIQGNVTVIINIRNQDFDQYGFGEWKVIVQVENGTITYDVEIHIIYNK